jgi:hypothetical protein
MKINNLAAKAAVLSLVMTGLCFGQLWNKKTKVTFSQPVSVPGVTLGAGTYIFRLADLQNERNVVQITNERQNRVYATVIAIPDYRLSATSKTVVTFGEQQPGEAIPIKSWFYPGDNYGQRFVYSKSEAQKIATTYKEPVPNLDDHVIAGIKTETSTTSAKITQAIQQPVTDFTPGNAQPAPHNAQTAQQSDIDDTAGFDGEPVMMAQNDVPAAVQSGGLPATASPYPLIAFAGLGFLMLAGLIRFATAKNNA